MGMSDTQFLTLAGEFPPASHQQWRALVDAALKGAPFDRLVHTTADGVRIEPLYPRRAGAEALTARRGPWEILQRVDHPDPAKANALALEDLENGATALLLCFAGGPSAFGYGLDGSEATIARALDGIRLDAVTIETDLSPHFKDAGHTLAALFRKQGVAPEKASLRLNYDPICAKAVAGSTPVSWRDLAPVFASMVRSLAEQGFRGPFAAANGRPVHAAGGSEAQELAFVIADALEYLRALQAAGMALDAARRLIYFRLAADTDQFMTMAKLRALRKLWSRIEEASGLRPEPVFIAAETAWRMMTRRDVHTNMLRTTIAALAAALGGADAISILPHTIALGLPDAFARRVARNTQLILLEESNLARVADPAAGSGGIEDLTDQLCRAAWSLFQEIERAGGAAEAVEKGVIQDRVAATRAERQAAIATRKDPLVGTSDYPDLGEMPAAVLTADKVSVPPLPAINTFPALAPIRLAEPFERLRDASDEVVRKTGLRPKIALIELGTPADFTARANFAKNLFEAGGLEAVELAVPLSGDGEETTRQIAGGMKASGAALACLCSSDEIYERAGADAARALAAAGARPIYLAGRPKNDAPYREAGVSGFIHAGCDALAILRQTHDILGIGA
jgi:methylmalonyl-CoA mutase